MQVLRRDSVDTFWRVTGQERWQVKIPPGLFDR